MSTCFWCSGSSTERGLKNGFLFFTDWLCSVIALLLGLKTMPEVLDTNSTHRHRICSPALHTCDCMGCARHVARSSKIHRWLLGHGYAANFSFHKKWKCPHLYLTFSAVWTKHGRPLENTHLYLTLGLIINWFICMFCVSDVQHCNRVRADINVFIVFIVIRSLSNSVLTPLERE